MQFTTIGAIAKVRGGKRLHKGRAVQGEQTDHPYIRIVDFREDGFDPTNVKFISEEAHREVARYTISSDDIYISIAGTIGRVGIIPRKYSGANLTENSAKISVTSKDFDKRFVMYYLRSQGGQAEIASKTVGTSQPKLALFRIGEIKIPRFPLSSQLRIASALSSYDDLIENNLRRIKILEEMTQLIYREWFINSRFPGHQKARIVKSELGEVPEGWTLQELGRLCELRKDRFLDRDLDLPLLDMSRMPQQSLAVSDFGDPEELATARILFEKDDILFGSIRTYLHKVCLAPCRGVTNVSVFVIRPHKEAMKALLAVLLFSKDTVRWADQHSTGTKMPVIKWDLLRKMLVLVPDEGLLSLFDKQVKPMLEFIQTSSLQNRLLRQTRDLLLPKLISGQLDVADLDIKTNEDLG